jgi:hypothetical protein
MTSACCMKSLISEISPIRSMKASPPNIDENISPGSCMPPSGWPCEGGVGRQRTTTHRPRAQLAAAAARPRLAAATRPDAEKGGGDATNELLLAILVIVGPEVRVRQDLVGLANFLELCVRIRRRVPVGVVLSDGRARRGR